jgi:hypothetical protein
MEQTSLINSAVMLIFFDNDIENSRYLAVYQGIFTPGDLQIAFDVAEAYRSDGVDVSLDWAMNKLGERNLPATHKLTKVANAVNNLRKANGIEKLISEKLLGYLASTIQNLTGNKRKYDELLEQTEQEARQRAAVARINQTFER